MAIAEAAELPAEEQDAEAQEQMIARLDAFGESLARTRAEYIAGREQSGIEEIWAEDEEFYQGIDDLNRGDERLMWTQKIPGQAPAKKKKKSRSRVFPNLTGPFVDAASARMADMLLPTDDRPWSLKPTPIPEMVGIAGGDFSADFQRQVSQQTANDADYQQALATAKAEAMKMVEQAKAKAKKAEKRIEDWHVECQWHAECRLVIEDSARCGAGVLKGPIPLTKRHVIFKDGGLSISERLLPGSKRIDFWNFYPDPACGENIHNGSGTWERDYVTRKQLRELMMQEGYIESQILRCLQEGPQRATSEYRDSMDPQMDPIMKDKFEIWYFHGTAERVDLEAAGCDCEDVEDPHVPAIVTMVNNRVVRSSLNPLDTGDFPYDVMVWRRRAQHWAGIGVARQIRTAQKIVTAATRNLMDNAGLAGGPMLVFHQGKIEPADGDPTIGPRKVFYIKEDAEEMKDARYAVGVIKVDILVDEMLKIVELGLKLAEHVTGLPMLLQGQMGKAPDTVGGMTMLENNASSVLRRLARTFDDRITEPHLRRYYVWLLQYGEDDEKGDFTIDARGSSALVERDIQNQELAQLGQIVLDPRFGKDPRKWIDEYLKSRHFDPKRFDFDDEKWQQILANMANGPQDQSLAIAELKAKSEEFKKYMDERIKQTELAHDAAQRDIDRQVDIVMKGLEKEIAMMELEGQSAMKADELRTKLADTTLKLKTQIKLAGQKAATEVLKPPTEPPGRAKAGESYQA